MAKLTEQTEATTAGVSDKMYAVVSAASRWMYIKNFFKSWFGIGNKHLGEFSSLSDAVSTIGSTQCILTIPANTTVSASLTIPATMLLHFSGSAQISVSSGQVLTINSSGKDWPLKQLFTGNGSVSFGPLVTEKRCEWFGALANASDDSAAMNKTIAAGSGAIILQSEPAIYGVSDALTGTISNVTFTCPKGGAVIKALTADKILDQSFGTYSGWKFQNVELYGESFLYDTRGIEFDNCKFRFGLDYAIQMAGVRKAKFTDCSFYGTRSGVMAANDDDPAAVSGAVYGSGIRLQQGCSDIELIDPQFHFCSNGIGADTIVSTNAMRGLKIRGGYFRGDWWNSPYIVARITPTAYNNTTRVLTASGGGFTAAFTGHPLRVFSVPIEISTGSSFNTLFAGIVGVASGTPFADAQKGDVIETTDGKRAEVVSKISSTQVSTLGWESVDTFETTSPPAAATAFRLTRYYACGMAVLTSDTQITLYGEPVNPYSGERLVSDAGLTPVGKVCRVFATMIYSGMHLNGGVFDFEISGATVRGSRSDQISVFNCDAPNIHHNKIRYGFDGGVTITASSSANVSNNDFEMSGAAAVWLGSDHAVIEGNTVNTWGVIDNSGLAAFDGSGLSMSIRGNTIRNVAGGPGSGSVYSIRFNFAGDCTGTIIEGNPGIDSARTAAIYADASAGAFIARDFTTIAGPGAASVKALIATNTIAPTTSAGTAVFGLDVAAGVTLTLANNATATPFGGTNNFSGIIIITETSINGATAIFATGGGSTRVVSDGAGVYSQVAATASKTNIYSVANVVTIENKLGSQATYQILAFRTRAAG